jgi:hypothetical protein
LGKRGYLKAGPILSGQKAIPNPANLFACYGRDFRECAENLGWECVTDSPHTFTFSRSDKPVRLEFYADPKGELSSMVFFTSKIRALAPKPKFNPFDWRVDPHWAEFSTQPNVDKFLADNPEIQELAELGMKLLTEYLDVSNPDELTGLWDLE